MKAKRTLAALLLLMLGFTTFIDCRRSGGGGSHRSYSRSYRNGGHRHYRGRGWGGGGWGWGGPYVGLYDPYYDYGFGYGYGCGYGGCGYGYDSYCEPSCSFGFSICV